GEREQVDADVGADEAEAPGAVLDVAGSGLERLAGERLRVVDRSLRRDPNRRAAGEERARAGAAETVAARGVALDDADPVDRHAEDVDRELRIAGRDALPHRLRRREDLDDAVGRDVDADLLLERIAAGPFEERGDAAAAQQAARLRLGATRGEAVPVGEREALVEDLLE